MSDQNLLFINISVRNSIVLLLFERVSLLSLMSILFEEKEVKHKKPRKNLFEEPSVLKDSDKSAPSEQSGEDLYANCPPPPPEKPPSDSIEHKSAKQLRELRPLITRFVVETIPDKNQPADPSLVLSPDDEFGQSVAEMAIVYDRMGQIQGQIDQKIGRLGARIREVEAERSRESKLRAAELITLDMRRNLTKLNDEFLDSLREDMHVMITYAKALRAEDPSKRVHIKVNELTEYLNEFPWSYPPAKKLKRQELTMKAHLKRLTDEFAKKVPIDRRFSSIFLRLDKIIDAETGYFPDHGFDEGCFQTSVEKMPADFKRRLNLRISQCISEPEKTGPLILDQCKDLAKVKKFDQAKTGKYMFLLFTRFYFSSIYQTEIAPRGASPEAQEFQRRVFRLRKLTPMGFGVAVKFLWSKLSALRLQDFPKKHLYSDAVEMFQQLSFQVCPVDFCRVAQKSLAEIQKQARKLAFQNDQQKTGQVVAESDHSLCLDELFDITTIVFLLSDPVDTLTLVQSFSPYITTLQLPASFSFAFTNINAICEHIMGLDMKEFIREAKRRLEEDQDDDPLNLCS